MTHLIIISSLCLFGAALCICLGFLSLRVHVNVLTRPISYALLATTIIFIQIIISTPYFFEPGSNNNLFSEDHYFSTCSLLWSPTQLFLHWLLTQSSRKQLSLGYRHALLFLCGLTITVGGALIDTIYIIPVTTVLTALSLPLILKTNANSNSGEAALKALFDLRFAFLFWALACATGYSNLGTLNIQVWIQEAQSGYLPAMLALLTLLCSLFGLGGVFPFHSNRVDLFSGGNPVGAITIFLGFFYILGTHLSRSANLGVWPTQLVISDTPLAFGCLLAFVMFSLSALDQRTVDRLLGYLIVGNTTLLIPMLHFSDFQEPIIAHFGIMIAVLASTGLGTLLIYFAYIPLIKKGKENITWESCSGIGLTNPFLAFIFLLGLGNLSGFPGSLGFSARLLLVQNAFELDWLATGWVIIFSIPLQCFAVLRLASFLFFKKRIKAVTIPFPYELKIPGGVLFLITLMLGFLTGAQ